MINETVLTTEETTAYALGTAIGALINLKRMVEHNMTDHSNGPEGMRGMTPVWSKDEVMRELDRAIDKLDGIKYPYKY